MSELYVTADAVGGGGSASIGGTLRVEEGREVRVTIRFLDPLTPNHRGDTPEVVRVDLTSLQSEGVLRGDAIAVTANITATKTNRTVSHVVEDLTGSAYVRVRGTSSDELEPEPDPAGEDPWTDLWFYSNPVFLDINP